MISLLSWLWCAVLELFGVPTAIECEHCRAYRTRDASKMAAHVWWCGA